VSALPIGPGPRPGTAAAIALRPARIEDLRLVWVLRNDEVTRRASLDPAPIPWEIHERWFLASLERADRKIYIVSVDGAPEGVARLDIAGRAATVSIHLAPAWRGRGVGPAALCALGALAFGELGLTALLASVKADNAASISAFRKAGFVETERGAVVTFERRGRP